MGSIFVIAVSSSAIHRFPKWSGMTDKYLNSKGFGMTNAQSGLTVDSLLRELNNSYRGVDLRVLIAKPNKETTNDEWISIVLKMVFTNETETEIQEPSSSSVLGNSICDMSFFYEM